MQKNSMFSGENHVLYSQRGTETDKATVEQECNKLCSAFFAAANNEIAERYKQAIFKTTTYPRRTVKKDADGARVVTYSDTPGFNFADFECACNILK